MAAATEQNFKFSKLEKWATFLTLPRFDNSSRSKRVRDTDMVLLCLACHDASTDDLLGSTCDLNALDPRPNIDLTVRGHHVYVSTRIEEVNTMEPELCH